MELENVHPEEIAFQEKLFDSETSYLFLVTVRDQTCVMKVSSSICSLARF